MFYGYKINLVLITYVGGSDKLNVSECVGDGSGKLWVHGQGQYC